MRKIRYLYITGFNLLEYKLYLLLSIAQELSPQAAGVLPYKRQMGMCR